MSDNTQLQSVCSVIAFKRQGLSKKLLIQILAAEIFSSNSLIVQLPRDVVDTQYLRKHSTVFSAAKQLLRVICVSVQLIRVLMLLSLKQWPEVSK